MVINWHIKQFGTYCHTTDIYTLYTYRVNVQIEREAKKELLKLYNPFWNGQCISHVLFVQCVYDREICRRMYKPT